MTNPHPNQDTVMTGLEAKRIAHAEARERRFAHLAPKPMKFCERWFTPHQRRMVGQFRHSSALPIDNVWVQNMFAYFNHFDQASGAQS